MKTDFSGKLVEEALNCVRALLLLEGGAANDITVEGSFKELSFVQPVESGTDVRKTQTDAQRIGMEWASKMKLAMREDYGQRNSFVGCNGYPESKDGRDYIRFILYESPLRILHFMERAMELGIYDVGRAGDEDEVVIVVPGGAGGIGEGALLEPDGSGKLQWFGSDALDGMLSHPMSMTLTPEARKLLAAHPDTREWTLVRAKRSIVVLRPAGES